MELANVTRVEYHGQQIAPRHYVQDYRILQTNRETAIYRRGYNFYLSIYLDRDFNEDEDSAEVVFNFGRPGTSRIPDVTEVTLVLGSQDNMSNDPNLWGIRKDRVDPKVVMAEIHIPANALVGAWTSTVLIKTRGISSATFKVPEQFYIIFNPWSKEDTVYLENEEDRNEYVLNDIGKIWLGTWRYPVGQNWIYGQFEEIALTVAMSLLDKSLLLPEERGDPVRVSRMIAAMINADDGDNGLLVADLDGNNSDGVPPHAWTGSLPILDTYYRNGEAPVRYGLSWVFSAATVTICRALGIPCRSTTVYGSAVGSKHIIRRYDAFGNVDNDSRENFLWNFHVWNEVWMSRPQLPEIFNGWQVIDGTPQRTSEGVTTCGPAPVEAVRQQFTGYLYDTDFVYAKLNAVVRNYVKDENSAVGEHLISSGSNQAGRKIITKVIGQNSERNDDYVDITTSYKTEIGIDNGPTNDFTCKIVADRVPYGETLNFQVNVTNNSSSERRFKYLLKATSCYYNGKEVSEIYRKGGSARIAGNETVGVLLDIAAYMYLPKLVEQGYIQLSGFVDVQETTQYWTDEEYFIFESPKMDINTGDSYSVGDLVNVKVSFRNPLNEKLTNCFYMIDGPSDEVLTRQPYPDVQPLDEATFNATIKAGWRTGRRSVIAKFNSQQLPQVAGSVQVTIKSIVPR